MKRRLYAAALVLGVAGAARAGGWPQFRGPTGLGYTTEKNLPLTWSGESGRNVLWKAPLVGEGYASPIEVLAVNDLGDPNHASPAVSNGRLFIAGLKNLYCIGGR